MAGTSRTVLSRTTTHTQSKSRQGKEMHSKGRAVEWGRVQSGQGIYRLRPDIAEKVKAQGRPTEAMQCRMK